jgi:predicted HD superfamily hydrolase involved in NAD metabolism
MRPSKINEIQAWVSGRVSPYRLKHIRGVVKTSEALARKFSLPVEKARLAAWLHDSAKELPRPEMLFWIKKGGFSLDPEEAGMPGLWHPHAAAGLALCQWGIKDKGVLEAVRCHTLGSPKMGPLAQLVFVADFIEPSRVFKRVEMVRGLARKNLTGAVLAKASMTVQFLFEKKLKIHPRLLETWNSFLGGKP